MASAEYTVDAAAVSGAMAVTAGASVALALASTTGVNSVVWSIDGNHAESAVNPTITPAGAPSGVTASFTMPAGSGQAYLVKCVINGGRDASGNIVSAWTFTAIIGVVGGSGVVPFTVGETLERSTTHGYTEDLNAIANATAASLWETNLGGELTVLGTPEGDHEFDGKGATPAADTPITLRQIELDQLGIDAYHLTFTAHYQSIGSFSGQATRKLDLSVNGGTVIILSAGGAPEVVGTDTYTSAPDTDPTIEVSGGYVRFRSASKAGTAATHRVTGEAAILRITAPTGVDVTALVPAAVALSAADATPSVGGATTLQIDTFFANGTWTSPAKTGNATIMCWGGGAGGTTNTGAGGGGAYSEAVFAYAASTGYSVGVGAAVVADTDGINTTFDTTTVVADAGLSGTNGSTGGTAAASTGTTKYDGGDGGSGTGTKVGGGCAGRNGAAALSVPGEPQGGAGTSSFGRYIGAGGGSTAAVGRGGIRGECRVEWLADATTGFPRIVARADGRDTTSTTSRPAVMPAGITASNRLLLFVASDGNPTVTVSGWTLVNETSNGTNSTLSIFEKTAAGSDTATVVTSVAEMCAYEVIEMTGAVGAIEATATTATSTHANSPSHSPSGGSAKTLWFSVVAGGNGLNLGGGPASYHSVKSVPSFNTTGSELLSAERFLEAASEDPGAWVTNVSSAWVATTLSVEPS